ALAGLAAKQALVGGTGTPGFGLLPRARRLISAHWQVSLGAGALASTREVRWWDMTSFRIFRKLGHYFGQAVKVRLWNCPVCRSGLQVWHPPSVQSARLSGRSLPRTFQCPSRSFGRGATQRPFTFPS